MQRAFRHLNRDTSYCEQVKPFNFVLSAAGAKPPAGVDLGASFRLVAPYESDARRWEEIEWVDVHNPKAGPYRITARDGRPEMARVDTFLDVVDKYETHPESKALGTDGRPCGRSTVGLLQRRHVVVGEIVLIGKEANRIEELLSGQSSINDRDERVTIYHDDSQWTRTTLPLLKSLGTKVAAAIADVSERRARDWLNQKSTPHGKTMATLNAFAQQHRRAGCLLRTPHLSCSP